MTLDPIRAQAVDDPEQQVDTTYYPERANGTRVYLSRACHGPDLGPNCISNPGCDGFSENAASAKLAIALKDELTGREYAVRIGNSGARRNVDSSNSWGADIHLPLHSNAAGDSSCVSGGQDRFGGEYQYRGPKAKELAHLFNNELYYATPGDNDVYVSNTGNYENTAPNAVPVYVESEYHIWQRGVNYLRSSSDYQSYDWRMAVAVDRCRGYPRRGRGQLERPECSWS